MFPPDCFSASFRNDLVVAGRSDRHSHQDTKKATRMSASPSFGCGVHHPAGGAEHAPSVLARTVGFSDGFFVIPAVAERDLGGASVRKLRDAPGLVAAIGQRRASALGKLINLGRPELTGLRHGRLISECCARSRVGVRVCFDFLDNTHNALEKFLNGNCAYASNKSAD
jgi:hypothetical protein